MERDSESEIPSPLNMKWSLGGTGRPTAMIFDIGIIPIWEVRTVSFGTL
jgi:hypothetical protein